MTYDELKTNIIKKLNKILGVNIEKYIEEEKMRIEQERTRG